MKIAILGGSFNPLHIGHAMIADIMIKDMGYDKVLFIPTCIPPHKEIHSGISTKQRLEMVKKFCDSVTGNIFEVEPCEIERGGVSYTVDTLRYIVEKYKDKLEGKPALLMGQEIAAEFSKWKEPDEIVKLADIVIVPRIPDYVKEKDTEFHNAPVGHYKGDFNSEFNKEEFKYPCTVLDTKVLPVSSTSIRTKIAGNKSFKYLVPQPVFEYICDNGLYKNL